MWKILPMILVIVVFNSAGQVCLKTGMLSLAGLMQELPFFTIVVKVLQNPWILMGLLSYVISLGLWMVVLSKSSLSLAYPMLSLGYVVVALCGIFLFSETVTVTQWFGIAMIMAGVGMLGMK